MLLDDIASSIATIISILLFAMIMSLAKVK